MEDEGEVGRVRWSKGYRRGGGEALAGEISIGQEDRYVGLRNCSRSGLVPDEITRSAWRDPCKTEDLDRAFLPAASPPCPLNPSPTRGQV